MKVHGDCHVQQGKCRYSAPYRFIGQTLWMKLSEGMVHLYHEHELIAQHTRLYRAGKRATIDGHLPPDAKAYLMRDPTWCRRRAAEIGPECEALVRH